jgi:hypothetical protein
LEQFRKKFRRVEDVSNAYILVQHARMTIDGDINDGDDAKVSYLRKVPSNNTHADMKQC